MFNFNQKFEVYIFKKELPCLYLATLHTDYEKKTPTKNDNYIGSITHGI